MRKRLFEIIETAKASDRLSNVYDIFMMVTVASAIFGIAIIALPSGIITAGFMEVLAEIREDEKRKNETAEGFKKRIVIRNNDSARHKRLFKM